LIGDGGWGKDFCVGWMRGTVICDNFLSQTTYYFKVEVIIDEILATFVGIVISWFELFEF
jgi:hypothetical protein